MKTLRSPLKNLRSLPEIDLANFATLPTDEQKRSKLNTFGNHSPNFSYAPVRKLFAEIFNLTPGSLPLVGGSAKFDLENSLRKGCKSVGQEFASNLAVGRSLEKFVALHGVSGRMLPNSSWAIGGGRSVNFCLPMVLNILGNPSFVFIDPRKRKSKLTDSGRRFVFSMMHQQMRYSNPDYQEVGLGIIQFSDPKDGVRNVEFFSDDGVSLYQKPELEIMLGQIFAIWNEVQIGRQGETRSAADGTSGSLL